MPRRALLSLCLLALAIAGCGGGKKEDPQTKAARQAAEAYVHDLGNRDGEAVCGDVTAALRKQITDAVVRARGRGAPRVVVLAAQLPSREIDADGTATLPLRSARRGSWTAWIEGRDGARRDVHLRLPTAPSAPKVRLADPGDEPASRAGRARGQDLRDHASRASCATLPTTCLGQRASRVAATDERSRAA